MGVGGAEEKGRVNKQPPSCQLFLLFLEHLSQRKRRKRWTGSEEGKEITEMKRTRDKVVHQLRLNINGIFNQYCFCIFLLKNHRIIVFGSKKYFIKFFICKKCLN